MSISGSRTPGVYVDGKPLHEVDFDTTSDIGVVEIVGPDTELNYLSGAEVYTKKIRGLREVTGISAEPVKEGAYFIPPREIGHALQIGTITGDGSLVLSRI